MIIKLDEEAIFIAELGERGEKRGGLLVLVEEGGGVGFVGGEVDGARGEVFGASGDGDGGALFAEEVNDVVARNNFKPLSQATSPAVGGEASKVVGDEAEPEVALDVLDGGGGRIKIAALKRSQDGPSHVGAVSLHQVFPGFVVGTADALDEVEVCAVVAWELHIKNLGQAGAWCGDRGKKAKQFSAMRLDRKTLEGEESSRM